MHTPHTARRTRSHCALTALRLIGLVYIALCLPDIYAEFHQSHGASVARARLAAAIEPGPQRAGSMAARPYPAGLVQRTTVGDAVVATTRTATGEPLCSVRYADGTTTNSWEDGRDELCPVIGALSLPKSSPLDPAACAGARCWLAQAERALWRCTEETGTPEGCIDPEALRRHGLPETTPVVALQGVAGPPENAAVVNTSALMEGTVMYAIVAREPGAVWTLSYFSDSDEQAQLACSGAGCAASPRAL